MRKKNGERMKQIVVWLLLVAMMFTSQNGVVSAMELSEEYARRNEEVGQFQMRSEVALNSSSYVSMGGSHTAVITENGDLYCWGLNNYGQVGNGADKKPGEPPNQYIPTKVLSNVMSVYLLVVILLQPLRTMGIYIVGDKMIMGK